MQPPKCEERLLFESKDHNAKDSDAFTEALWPLCSLVNIEWEPGPGPGQSAMQEQHCPPRAFSVPRKDPNESPKSLW